MKDLTSKTKQIIFSSLLMSLPLGAMAQSQTVGLTVQFSRNDLGSMQQGIEESLQQGPVSGVSTKPMQSPYAFGRITATNISYQFQPSLQRLELLDGALGFALKISDFRGLVGRVTFNESGSMYCDAIPVHSGASAPHNTIAVNVLATPAVTADGSLSLVVPRAEVGLSHANFMIEEPAHCDVIYGLNWLVKWVLPSLINNYKQEVATGLAQALAGALKEQAGAMSPLLALDVTLPFDPVTTPAFYATIGVRPHAFSISSERFQSQFATSVFIDPDAVRRSFLERADWPSDKSLLGLSWELFDGLLSEAQAKGVIKTVISPKSKVGAAWVDHERWRVIWPDLASVVPSDQPLTLELLGGINYQWRSNADDRTAATLHVTGFQGRLRDDHRLLATVNADLDLRFSLTSTASGAIKAALQSMNISRERLDLQDSPLRRLVTRMDGFKILLESLAADIAAAPAERRELFNVTIPSLRLGSHQVVIREIEATEAGISLPLRYMDPR